MVTRRTDARRRRVLTEEFVPTDEAHDNDSADREPRPMRTYSFGADRRNQPKTTDLIPKRVLSLSFFFGVLLLSIAGLNSLAVYAVELSKVVGEAGVASMQLSGNGTLSNWLCSVSLFLCSAICIQLFLLRKFKRDDYGGMYRVWVLMSIFFVAASIDCVLDLRTVGAKVFEFATHRSLLQTPWLIVTIELILLGLLALRMLFEVRASKGSMACLTLAWLCFVGCCTLSRFDLPVSIGHDFGVSQQLVYGNCMLCGCLGTLAALTVYTRFVFLDAHGLIAHRVKTAKPKNSIKPKTKKAPTKKARKPNQSSKGVDSQPASNIAKSKASSSEAIPSAADNSNASTLTHSNQKSNVNPAGKRAANSAKSKNKKVASKNPSTGPSKAEQTQPTTIESPSEPSETVSLSKAERRRQRKLAKRAARDAA